MFECAFATSFLPSFSRFTGQGLQNSITRHSLRRRAYCQLNQPKPSHSCNRELPFIAVGVAAISLFFSSPPARAHEFISSPSEVSAPRVWTHKQPSEIRPALKVKLHQSTSADQSGFLIIPADDSSVRPPEGTLLQVEPSNFDDAARPDMRVGALEGPISQSTLPLPRSSGTATYPQHRVTTNSLPKWAAARVRRAVRAPGRLLLFRSRVRPSTLGIVGFGAFTSGSVFLRSVTRKRSMLWRRTASSSRHLTEEQPIGHCSVVCMHIPFCVPDRKSLLDGLSHLADTAYLLTADGMSAAARDAAALLLQEDGLLEDSRKFAPHVDVFLADNIASAERRFSGHVAIEGNRVERISGKSMGYDMSSASKHGQYGVITLVIATTEGVDLCCYDEKSTKVQRLRGALASVQRLHSGDIAGMELRWIPETTESHTLTRAQLADAFPSLRIA